MRNEGKIGAACWRLIAFCHVNNTVMLDFHLEDKRSHLFMIMA